MGVVLNAKNRGAKEGWYRMDPNNGPDAFLAKTKCPAIIVEPFFLDSSEERAKYIGSLSLSDAIASRVSAGIDQFLRGDLS